MKSGHPFVDPEIKKRTGRHSLLREERDRQKGKKGISKQASEARVV